MFTPEQIAGLHTVTQSVADQSVGASAMAIQMAVETGKALKEWQDSLPAGTDVEKAAEAVYSDDLQAWLPEYIKLAALKYGEPFNTTKPSVFQKAMKLLDLIPTIVQQKGTDAVTTA